MILGIVISLTALGSASSGAKQVQAAEAIVSSSSARILHAGTEVPFEQMVADLARADVVCLGEQHDHAEGHAFQLQLVQSLGSKAPSIGLSLEMFERDVQIVLDEYLQGHITESAYLAAARPWPRYKTDYLPLVEWCKANGRPVIAANVPRRYVNIVARLGQAALLKLPRASRAFLPRLPYSMDLPREYDAALDQVFGGAHSQADSTATPRPNLMKEAQGLWDHGMAESILDSVRKRRLHPVVHVVGSMHCERGFGIVDRLRRAAPRLRILTVIVVPQPRAGDPPLPGDLGDYVVLCARIEGASR